MSKPKFQYVSYDYTFLHKKKDGWSVYLPKAITVAAQTIGFDIVEEHPMNEPTGQLYWADFTYDDNAATTATASTYTTSTTGTTTNPWYDIYQFEKTKRGRWNNYFNKLAHYHGKKV